MELFRSSVKSSTALLLASPEYHGDISGVLKNALDLLEEEHMVGKVVALLAVVGGVHSTHALNTMRLICRQLHCWVLPEQVIIPHAEECFDEKGQLKDKQIEERLDHLIAHLLRASRQLVKQDSQ